MPLLFLPFFLLPQSACDSGKRPSDEWGWFSVAMMAGVGEMEKLLQGHQTLSTLKWIKVKNERDMRGNDSWNSARVRCDSDRIQTNSALARRFTWLLYRTMGRSADGGGNGARQPAQLHYCLSHNLLLYEKWNARSALSFTTVWVQWVKSWEAGSNSSNTHAHVLPLTRRRTFPFENVLIFVHNSS